MSKIETRMDQLEQFVQILTRQVLDLDHKNATTISHLNEIKAEFDEISDQFRQLELWHKRMWAGLTARQKKRLEIKNPNAWMSKRYEPSDAS